jgi:hypothetical protein
LDCICPTPSVTLLENVNHDDLSPGSNGVKPGDKSEQEAGSFMAEYYAHTADNGHPRPSDGRGAGGEGRWQLLSVHLRNVATLAKQFAAPLGLAAEAELAGLLRQNTFNKQFR